MKIHGVEDDEDDDIVESESEPEPDVHILDLESGAATVGLSGMIDAAQITRVNSEGAAAVTSTPTIAGKSTLEQKVAALNAQLARAVPVGATERTSRSFICEIEINDYPQKARWKVTQKVSFQSLRLSDL